MPPGEESHQANRHVSVCVLREATLSYHNIKQTKAFTVNIPSEKYVKEADFVGMVSGREYDKFKETRLTRRRASWSMPQS